MVALVWSRMELVVIGGGNYRSSVCVWLLFGGVAAAGCGREWHSLVMRTCTYCIDIKANTYISRYKSKRRGDRLEEW